MNKYVLATAVLLLLAFAAIADEEAASDRAWLDTRMIFMFHMGECASPVSTDQLADSLSEGFTRGLDGLTGRELVMAVGNDATQLDRLWIDLSHGTSTDTSTPRIGEADPSRASVYVDDLLMIAQPLVFHGARLDYVLRGSNVRFDPYFDSDGREVIVLSAAEHVELDVRIAEPDIQRLVLHEARDTAQKNRLRIDYTRVQITRVEDRAMEANLRVRARRGIFGATISMAGGIHIDDELVGHTHRLIVRGHCPFGIIAAGVLNTRARRYDGQSRALLSFASDEIELRDIEMSYDETLRLRLVFGNKNAIGSQHAMSD